MNIAKTKTNWVPILVVGVLLLLAYVIYSGKLQFQNVFQFTQNSFAPLNPDNQYYLYTVAISVAPSNICVGSSVTGTISSNIPNGICTVFVNPNNAGWQIFANVNLDSNGIYSTSQVISVTGTASFRAVCCDSSGNCKTSNDAMITVSTCGSTTTTTLLSTTTTTIASSPSGRECSTSLDCIRLGRNYRCVDGYCVYTTPETTTTTTTLPQPWCSDTDGGKDYWVKGTASDYWHANIMTDYCIGDTLYEYSCGSDSKFTFDTYECYRDPVHTELGGCVNGACVHYCYDEEGSYNIFTSGKVYSDTWHLTNYVNPQFESCMSSGSVYSTSEKWCEGTTAKSTNVQCPPEHPLCQFGQPGRCQ